jgi:hypothetical protein
MALNLNLHANLGTLTFSQVDQNWNDIQGNVNLLEASQIQNNFSATVDPTTSNNAGEGYSNGSRWYNQTNSKFFICVDAVAGTWVEDAAIAGDFGPAAFVDAARVAEWDAAFDWGNHAGLYAPVSHSHSAGDITSGTLALAEGGTGRTDGFSPRWITSRTLTIGATGKGVTGDADVSWTLAEIGAAPSANPDFTGRITEQVFAVTGTAPALSPTNGTIQTWALTANSSPTFAAGFVAGSSMTLMIDDGTARTITWPTMTWVGGAAPTLALTGYTVVELWRVGSTYYGALVGEVA